MRLPIAEDLTVLIPVFNEEATIASVLTEVSQRLRPGRILVVDDGSLNGTFKIAKEHVHRSRSSRSMSRVDLINKPNGGKGTAVIHGLDHIETPYMIMMDGDYTYPARHGRQVYGLLRSGADVVIGSRARMEKGAMTRLNWAGNRMLSKLASVLYGYPVKDMCSGLWGFRTEVVKSFGLNSNGFTLEADLFVNAVKNGCIIDQTDIYYRKRPGDSETKLRPMHGISIGWFLLCKRFGK